MIGVPSPVAAWALAPDSIASAGVPARRSNVYATPASAAISAAAPATPAVS